MPPSSSESVELQVARATSRASPRGRSRRPVRVCQGIGRPRGCRPSVAVRLDLDDATPGCSCRWTRRPRVASNAASPRCGGVCARCGTRSTRARGPSAHRYTARVPAGDFRCRLRRRAMPRSTRGVQPVGAAGERVSFERTNAAARRARASERSRALRGLLDESARARAHARVRAAPPIGPWPMYPVPSSRAPSKLDLDRTPLPCRARTARACARAGLDAFPSSRKAQDPSARGARRRQSAPRTRLLDARPARLLLEQAARACPQGRGRVGLRRSRPRSSPGRPRRKSRRRIAWPSVEAALSLLRRRPRSSRR